MPPLFKTNEEALIYLLVFGVGFYLLNKLLSITIGKSEKIPLKQKIIINFSLKIAAVLIVVFLVIEGFPLISLIDPTYTAVLTGAISTAIAFASSGIFSNFFSGIVIMLIRPFEVDDLVKIEGDKGIIRAINLTKVKLETFDNIIIEKSNGQVLSSKIVNYTIKLGKKKSFKDFKSKIFAPQDIGFKGIYEDISNSKKEFENNLKKAYDSFSTKNYPKLYNFTFRMAFPYKGFRVIINEVTKLCDLYNQKNIFRIKPQFDIVDYNISIIVKFRLLTFSPQKIFDFQPIFAKDVYNLIYKYTIS
ncbi:MAG TPA: mechanosensitive ion channel domain-containing protein [Candidatus Nanopelagicaceae bacterium]|nr:mechanosensitive ion channel domain-containing protein [Candidatus Nanopelagicaceae bacterium]